MDRARFEELAAAGHDLSPDECAQLARAAASLVDASALPREGGGSATCLWRDERSEGWLNTWWDERDTGFHGNRDAAERAPRPEVSAADTSRA